jgi:hypothetical protein
MPAPPPYTGVKLPDYNLGTQLLAYVWTVTAISAVVLAIRLFAVCHVLKRVRAADYAMVASFVRPICSAGI